MFFFFTAGEFVESVSRQSSWNEEEPDAKSAADSLLRSGFEEGNPVAGPAVNSEPDHMSTVDSQEEELIGTSSCQTPTGAGLRTYGSITEINDSDNKTEFDNKVLRSNESTRTQSEECQPPLSHNNTSSHSAPTNNNNLSNGYPFDPDETTLKSLFTTESPGCDQFSVDVVATGVRATGYSREATTELNSQPALKSPTSVRAFMPPNHSFIQNALTISDLGIELVNVSSSSSSGQLPDYQSTLYMGDSSEDTISSDGSVSTDQDYPVSTST